MTSNDTKNELTIPPLRWGVVGTGWIARSFAEDLRLLPGARSPPNKIRGYGSRPISAAWQRRCGATRESSTPT